MEIGTDIQAGSTLLFKRMVKAIWILLIFYIFIFYYSKAFAASAVLFIGAVIIQPLIIFLENRGKQVQARLLFNISSSFYIFLSGLCFEFQAATEFFYPTIVIGAFLIFKRTQVKELIFVNSIAFGTWMLSKVIPLDLIPDSFFAKGPAVNFVIHANHISSFALTMLFIIIFVETIGKLNEKSLAMSELLLRTEEDAKIGSWSFDIKSNVLSWSDQTYRIHELEIGTKLDVGEAINFYHHEDRERITQLFNEAISSGNPFEDNFRLITAKGHQIWVKSIGRVVKDKDGEVVSVEGSFQDITESKKADMAKTEFLATMSHEMRTPLMSVIGLSDLLKDSGLKRDQKELADNIVLGGQAALTVINDVLDLSKVKSKALKLSLQNVDLIELVESTVEFLKFSAHEKDLDFNYHINIKNRFIKADQVRLRQILINFISNAIKYTDNGEVKVLIEEKVITNEYGVFIFKIIDTGIGMNKDFIPKIFDEFEQDEHNGEMKVGTGLGMPITKKLVNLMDGDIKVVSEKGVGSTFTANIKFQYGKEIVKKKKKIAHVDFKSASILYVDDDKSNQFVVSRLLAKTNCVVSFADNGKEALNEFKKRAYDIIIMDIQMPIMDGVMATKEIRQHEKQEKLGHVPIIAFSAFTFEEEIQKARNAGCDDYLKKPIRKAELVEKLLAWVPSRKNVVNE